MIPEHWEKWLALLEQGREQPIRMIIETHGGAPDTMQRKQFMALFRQVDMRGAVMTDNALARGAVTAFAWLGISLRAFPLNSFPEVCAYLELDQAEREQAAVELLRVRRVCFEAAHLETSEHGEHRR